VTDLISTTVGGRIVAFNDEFFAEAENLLKPTDPVWKEDLYTDRGKWMDGWETRRRREPGHDWCVIALGIPGTVRRVTVDTSYFTGNYAEAFSLEACGVGADDGLSRAEWVELIPRSTLDGDTTADFEVAGSHRVTHLRLNIFPDGGVARLRVDGDPVPSIDEVCPESGVTDLASSLVGGMALEASDVHYSDPSNLLRPTDPAGMWDGWETKRRRGPGHDWASFRLGLPGTVESVVLDTRHFKGNAPGWVSMHVSDDGEEWREVVSRAKVNADTVNTVPVPEPTPAAFLRLDIHPDGGVARLRVMGAPDPDQATARRLVYLNSLFEAEARSFFNAACASTAWVESLTASRPFPEARDVLAAATAAFDALSESDWLEAFAGHPRIGELGDAAANREQAATSRADDAVLRAIAEANRRYEAAHGFTYIVYATGKSADEMLDIARERLANPRQVEITNAATEQRAITTTRLRRMLCMGDDR
jgi:allantoicase